MLDYVIYARQFRQAIVHHNAYGMMTQDSINLQFFSALHNSYTENGESILHTDKSIHHHQRLNLFII